MTETMLIGSAQRSRYGVIPFKCQLELSALGTTTPIILPADKGSLLDRVLHPPPGSIHFGASGPRRAPTRGTGDTGLLAWAFESMDSGRPTIPFEVHTTVWPVRPRCILGKHRKVQIGVSACNDPDAEVIMILPASYPGIVEMPGKGLDFAGFARRDKGALGGTYR